VGLRASASTKNVGEVLAHGRVQGRSPPAPAMMGGRERRAGGAGAALSKVAGALAAKLEDRAERGGFEVSTIVATLAAIAPGDIWSRKTSCSATPMWRPSTSSLKALSSRL
jgi:hypothetical protein